MLALSTPEAASLAEPAAQQADGSLPALATLDDQQARDLVQLFKLLADETRLRIMYFLMQKEELNVRTLCRLLDQSQPAVSHHLALLRVAGILECRRDGKHNFYRLVPKRCQAFLDTVFGVSGHEIRKVRLEDAVLTYERDGQPA
jgi:ArsR family transcriptional regulator, arsenate/arsenite/antimonite-responsive transcriptional repressor